VAPRKSAGSGASGSGGPLAPIIHGRARLLILSALVRQPRPCPFTTLRDQLGFSDGSLSVNLAKLEEAGYVRLTREFVGKKPQTLARITPDGREAFGRYVAELRRIVPGLEE
jgi:DNA-binding MarR family transcriptional regulator